MREARCGTPSGANKHRRDGTPVCEPCRKARYEAAKDYRERNPNRPPVDIAWKGQAVTGSVVIEGGHWVRDGLILRPVGPRPVDTLREAS